MALRSYSRYLNLKNRIGIPMNDKKAVKAVEVKKLTYQYRPGGPLALKDIDFRMNRGEMAAVAGLSGCGKSTLCMCLSGAARYNRDGIMTGEILLNGKDIYRTGTTGHAPEVGIVFQNPDTQLFSFTVEDEIAFAPENLCLPPDCIRERVEDVLNLLGIAHLREEHPCHLSGGEKSLVALGAVLALDPPVLVLDEVMCRLDTAGKKRVKDVLRKLRDRGKTIIAVEHNMDDIAFADRIIVMGEGKLLCSGTIQDCRRTINAIYRAEPGKLLLSPENKVGLIGD
ncbi:ABC transporter ATP-binding protein [Petroclostridium sp. X23]|uniref:energy-coupling factor ABC transporter ATP-binding protein n=1 Tax=Petroclostridium sp. X23 TaxID=3045146 RepID=UPI0024ACBF9E|nr:ABC transporter ATP-binding protein [Petroclostridium sp. X23]WHH57772.1 ABC transporter ATP-binding protein [Petroclostridium sp. X23]